MPFFYPFFSLCPCFCPLVLVSLCLMCFACPLVLSCLFLWSLLLFPFPFRTTRKKRGRKGFAPCVLSWCVIDLVGVRFPVFVKFVIVSVNLFGYTFIGGRIFVIISPLLEKAFEDTLNKIPRIKFVLYALFYVV